MRHSCFEADGAVKIGQTHIVPSQVAPSTVHSPLSVQGPPISVEATIFSVMPFVVYKCFFYQLRRFAQFLA